MEKDYPIARPSLPPGIRLEENVCVTMRDGIKIAVDVYLPEAEGRYPAILSMSPYLKELQQWSPMLTHSIEAGATGFFVPKGYVHIIGQIRGTGFSQGQWNFFDTKEQQDGYDLIEWIAQQPWCDGNVGMMGDSYFSMIQFLVAAQNPPHLKCLVPFDGSTDIYRDFVYKGGVCSGWLLGIWLPDTIQQCIWPGPIEGKLPPANLMADLALHSEDGPYYWERSGYTKLDKIDVPILNISPAGLSHSRGQLYAYPSIKAPKKLIIVPPAGAFAHVQFINNGPLHKQMLRWFDHWLKGVDTGIMDEPEIAICDAATQEWRYENEYPLSRTQWTTFYLRENPAGPATEPPYGLIDMEAPGSEKPDSYMTPESMGKAAANQPALAYATPPLEKDVRVWGPLSAVIYGSSTTLDTIWFVKLGDVGTKGEVSLLSQGILRASYREIDEAKSRPGQPFHPFRDSAPPEPGTIYEYQIELWPVFHTFKVGHKILVQISSFDFQYQMELHSVYSSEMLPIPAENTVYHDAARPSHLLLPVIPDAPTIKSVEPPVCRIVWPTQYG